MPIKTKKTPMQMAVISRGIGSTTKRKTSTANTAKNLMALGERPLI